MSEQDRKKGGSERGWSEGESREERERGGRRERKGKGEREKEFR